MNALVYQYATALTTPGGPPITHLKIHLGAKPVGHSPIDTNEIAQITGSHDFAHSQKQGICTLIQHESGYRTATVCSSDQFLTFSYRQAHRLFHHQVQPGIEHGSTNVQM